MKLSLVLTALVSVLLSVALVSLIDPGSDKARTARGEVARPNRGIEDLEARIARLEEGLRDLQRASLSVASPVERSNVANSGGGDSAALLQRIAELESRLGQVEGEVVGPAGEARGAMQEERERLRQETIRMAKETLMDPAATTEELLAAHEALRRIENAYTPQMVEDLVHLATNDPSGEVRADVWRFFDGATRLPELVPHLRNALSNDSDPRTRAEAAETLANYADDPDVLAALKYALENDPSPEVKRKLGRVLAEWTAWLAQNQDGR